MSDRPLAMRSCMAKRWVAKHLANTIQEAVRGDFTLIWKGRRQHMSDPSIRSRWVRLMSRYRKIARGKRPFVRLEEG